MRVYDRASRPEGNYRMIIWINGAFGSGKSETAGVLHRRIPESHIFDPENTGEYLWKNLPPQYGEGCFQDIPLWRSINLMMLETMDREYDGAVIVPMTITDEEYFYEIVGGLMGRDVDVRHFTLLASRDTLMERLIRRGDGGQSWAARQIDRCLKYHPLPVFAEHIQNDELTAEQVADIIMDRLK